MVHLGKGEIEDFLAGRLEASNRRRVILHLLDGCSLCQRRLRSLAEPLLGEEPLAAAEPVTEESYDEALSHAGAAAKSFLGRWRKERAKLQRALSLLEQFPKGFEDASFPARQAQALHG